MSVGSPDVAPVAVAVLALLPPGDPETEAEREREAAARQRLGFASEPSPHDASLPKVSAILGPLPPSAPLSVANAFLSLAHLPPFQHNSASPSISDPSLLEHLQPKARVLVLTGPRAALHLALEDEDATYLRGHDYGLFDRLQRTDVRYCPSATHLRLLLAVLNGAAGEEGEGAGKVLPPSMVVLYDVLGLMMAVEERDENAPPEEEGWEDAEEGPKVLRPGVTLSTYLEIVAAALDLTRAASEDGRGLPLLILEPHGDIELPLLPPAAETTVPQAQRTRTFRLSDGLRRLGVNVGIVSQLETETEFPGQRTKGAKYELAFNGQTFPFARRVGTKSEFACPPPEEGEALEEGGWVWEWT